MGERALVPQPGLPIVAQACRRGLVIPLEPFRDRLGGQPALRRVLCALEVTEKVHPGRPKGMGRAVRKAWKIERVPGGDVLVIPRLKGPPFLRARTAAGRPFLDALVPGPDALPAPRRLGEDQCEPAVPLYSYQQRTVSHLCDPGGPLSAERVAACQGSAYLQMDTGMGKTRTGLAVIAKRREPALIVVPTDAIGVQWLDELRALYPGMRGAFYRNPTAKSRRAPAGPATHDVVVVIVNTFRDKDPDFLEGYGTVLLDEAHEYHSPCNGRALWLAQASAVLGLSATPEERPDGLDRYVSLHLGAPIRSAAIPGFDVADVNFRAEVREVVYGGHPDYCNTISTPAGVMSAILTIDAVLPDPYRLRLVAAEVARLYHLHETAPPEELVRLGLGPRPESAATPDHPAGGIRRHGIFVFAEIRKYLPALRGALLAHFAPSEVAVPELEGPGEAGDEAGGEAGDVTGSEAEDEAGAVVPWQGEDSPEDSPGGARPLECPKMSILMGGVSRGAVGDARRAGAHVVLTTYGYSRRGISLADMTAIVLASPRRNGSRQFLGRVFRRGSDESILRQIVDIVDSRTGLKSQITDRRKVYNEASRMYPITRVAVDWQDLAGDDPAEDAAVVRAAAAAEEDQALEGLSTEDLLALCLGD